MLTLDEGRFTNTQSVADPTNSYIALVFLLTLMLQAVISGTRPSATECNEFVRTSYCWRYVARRTEIVYQSVSTGLKPTLARKVGLLICFYWFKTYSS